MPVRYLTSILCVLAACGGGDPTAGGERAVCRSDGTCEVGLECWSEVCVRPPSADCGAVARRLAAVKLGNYATDDERRPMLAELRAQCQQARLTAREGQCLAAAADDDALAECPRALLPELDGTRRRCAALGDRVIALGDGGGALIEALGDDAVEAASAIVVDSCLEDQWPKAVTTCVGDAATLDAARACADALPRSVRRSLERKLERLATRRRPRLPPPDPWATPPTVVLTGSCHRYLAVLERYAACPQLPADAARSIRAAIDALKTSWASTPASTRATIDTACRQGLDPMIQGMRAMGCTVPP